MYHSARAITFAVTVGDDHQSHPSLPRNLPPGLPKRAQREVELTDARLIRNQADYDCYPTIETEWRQDARRLAPVAADFVGTCEDFALLNGFI